ncbi:MAG: hypothetical protein ACE5ER_08485 [Nitrospinaceae bacterium]
MNIQVGDHLYEPLSRNNGEVTKIINHPQGKLITIRWRVDDHIPHDTEHFHKKLLKAIKNGDLEYTPLDPSTPRVG